jgi:hypothetical protein
VSGGVPLCIDLFCGLGGWTEGFISEGWRVVGFDIEQHVYGEERYPAQLVLQDVRTIHGKQFKDADMIVASSPCQEFSYRAMPWKRAKALGPPLLGMELFAQAARIQAEAIEAAGGRFIPMIQENVRGAEKYVGKAAWHFGSYYLWGNVPALMPLTTRGVKVPGLGAGWRPPGHPDHKPGISFNTQAERHTKNTGGSWFNIGSPGQKVVNQNPTRRGHDSFGWSKGSDVRKNSSKSTARKAASARIAKIPFPLSSHIARVYYPKAERAA